MEFQKTSTAATLALKGIVQGRRILIVITNAPSAPVLEFQHAGDTWRTDPRFVGTTDGHGTIIQELIAPSADVRLKFTGSIGSAYFVSVAQEFIPRD